MCKLSMMFLIITSTNMYLAYLHSARPCLRAGYLALDDQQYMVLPLKRNQTHSQSVSSVAQSCLTLRNPMNCSTPGLSVHHQLLEFSSNSCPLSWWCHPTILSLVLPFSSCLQSFPASGSFQMSQLFTSGGQTIRVSTSTSVLPVKIQD